MTLISSGTLSALQTLAASLRTDTATISRPSRASDGQGGWVDTFASAGTVAVYLTPMRQQPTEGIVAERLQGRVGYYAYVPAGTDVRATDRLSINSISYEVLGVQAPATLQVHVRVDCAREE